MFSFYSIADFSNIKYKIHNFIARVIKWRTFQKWESNSKIENVRILIFVFTFYILHVNGWEQTMNRETTNFRWWKISGLSNFMFILQLGIKYPST